MRNRTERVEPYEKRGTLRVEASSGLQTIANDTRTIAGLNDCFQTSEDRWASPALNGPALNGVRIETLKSLSMQLNCIN